MILRYEKNILYIFLLVISSGCYFDEINQPENVGTNQSVSIYINIVDNVPETNNPHKGILSVLVPEDWEFNSGTYSSANFSGSFLQSDVWKDSTESCYPAVSFGSSMKWITLISDTGYTYENETSVSIELSLASGTTEGCFSMAYLTTKATPNLICSGNSFAPLSYPHHVQVGNSTDCNFPPEAAPENQWSELFHRYSGWTGADGIYSIPLNGNETNSEKTLFVFSDTFIGDVDSLTNQRLAPTYMVNNTYAILEGSEPNNDNIQFYYDTDSDSLPKSFFEPNTPNSGPGDWYWLMDGISINETIYLYALRMDYDVPPFSVDGVALLKFRLGEENQLLDVEQFDTPLFHQYENGDYVWYGQAIMALTNSSEVLVPDNYIYFYGVYNSYPLSIKHMTVSRTMENTIEDYNSWEYWNGSGWVSDISEATFLTQQISPEFSVTQISSNKYIAVFQQGGVGRSVAYRTANHPTGPFGSFNIIWDAPEYIEFSDVSAYNAKAHPHLSDGHKLIISYNVNTTIGGDFWYHFDRGDLYRPRFISINIDDVIELGSDPDITIPNKEQLNLSISCFPNPFNSSISIDVRGIVNTSYNVAIYDLAGRIVFDNFLSRNDLREVKTYKWEGIRNDGSFAGTGIYFVKLQSHKTHFTKKIILLK